MLKGNITAGVALWVSLAAGLGCASTPPPRELVVARQAYDRAADGPARALVPADLHVAQLALNRAEQSYIEAPDSQATRDLAYIAERKAELSESRATLAMDERNKATAQADFVRTLEQNEKRGLLDLSKSREQLAADRQFMAVQQSQLTDAQRARADSERRARLALESLENIAAVREEARGLVITLNGAVLFASNQATLLPIAQDKLEEVARAINDQPERAVLIEGHTDSTGAASLNQDLSLRRAKAVREQLIARGVPADRVRAVGRGADRPVADNTSAEGRANNRRVEIVLQPAGASAD